MGRGQHRRSGRCPGALGAVPSFSCCTYHHELRQDLGWQLYLLLPAHGLQDVPQRGQGPEGKRWGGAEGGRVLQTQGRRTGPNGSPCAEARSCPELQAAGLWAQAQGGHGTAA